MAITPQQKPPGQKSNPNPISQFDNAFFSAQDLQIDISSIDIFSLARHGQINHIKKILEYGVDPNSKDRFGNTLLIIGTQNGNKAVIKLALRYGAHINMTNCLGNTALHFAVEYKYDLIRDYLIKKGGNPKI